MSIIRVAFSEQNGDCMKHNTPLPVWRRTQTTGNWHVKSGMQTDNKHTYRFCIKYCIFQSTITNMAPMRPKTLLCYILAFGLEYLWTLPTTRTGHKLPLIKSALPRIEPQFTGRPTTKPGHSTDVRVPSISEMKQTCTAIKDAFIIH